jgi:hypothetical protein
MTSTTIVAFSAYEGTYGPSAVTLGRLDSLPRRATYGQNVLETRS